MIDPRFPAATRARGRAGRSVARPELPPSVVALMAELLDRHRVRVHRWRTSMSGVAWVGAGPDGPLTRWIESPEPRSSMSWSIFLHEVAHHAIGIGRLRPRCLEEYHAWRWSLETMRERELPVTDAVERRMRLSLQYAAAKALRRGIGRVPVELEPFLAVDRGNPE